MIIRPEYRKIFPRGRIPETLLMFIRLRGGANAEVNSEFVYSPLADFYELSEDERRLSAADYYTGESGAGLAWNSEVNAAVKGLKKDGYLTIGAGPSKHAWRLTPTGLERADFWLKRMTDKSAALSSLKVDANLPRREQESSLLRKSA